MPDDEIGISARCRFRRRVDVLLRNVDHFIDAVDNEPEEARRLPGTACTAPRVMIMRIFLTSFPGGLEFKTAPEIDDGYDRAPQIDDPFDKSRHFGKGRDLSAAGPLR